MAAPTGTSQAGVSIHEAAVLLNVSPNTVRRWCASGRLRSERVARPQGETIRVYLDGAARQVPGDVPPGEVPRDVPIDLPGDVPATSHGEVPVELARAGAMAQYNESLMAPLVAELAAYRERLEVLARENGTLIERMAGLERVRDAAMAHAAELEARLAERPDPRPELAPDPFPRPIPPTPNVLPRRRLAPWRRWLGELVLGR